MTYTLISEMDARLGSQTRECIQCSVVPRGCAGGRIGTRFLRPRGTSPVKGVNPAGTPGYRNGTESFFGLKGRPSVVRDV
jgi:hypothetical protein